MIQLFRDYFAVLSPRRRRGAVGLVLLLTASGIAEAGALAMLIPLISPDSVLNSDNALASLLRDRDVSVEGLARLALVGFAILGLGSAVLRFSAEAAILRMRVRTELDMRVRLTDALLNMTWTSFHSMRLGDISKAIVAEGNNASLGLQVLLQATGNALIAVLFTLSALALSPQLTLFTLTFAGAIAFVYRWVNRHAEIRSRELSASTSRIGEEAEDVFSTLKFVRSTGGVGDARGRALSLYRGFSDLSFNANVLISGMRFLFELAGVLFVGAVLATAVIGGGGLSAGSIAFLALFYRLAPRLHAVQEQVLLARTYRSWLLTWLTRLRRAEMNADARQGRSTPSHKVGIELEGVTVRYPGSQGNALDDVSLSIPAGSCIAVVGESGSGKSTMLDLLTGLITPTSGRVVLDGRVDTSEVDIAAWQDRIGLVLQETPIYHASVAENIAWQLPDVARQTIVDSADAAYAKGFIDALPEGFDTVVGERGGRLSGGQRQRLALARALCRSPWLLVLDEATSALDSESEALVLAALERAKGTSTMVLVAHRLTSAQMADEVIVMSDGRIDQRGSFQDLLADTGGQFAAMAAKQGLLAGT